jgi:hypothetical protein
MEFTGFFFPNFFTANPKGQVTKFLGLWRTHWRGFLN